MGLDIDIVYTDGEVLVDELIRDDEGYKKYFMKQNIQYYRSFWALNHYMVDKFGEDIDGGYIELDYDRLMNMMNYFKDRDERDEIEDLINRCLIKINKGKRIFYCPSW